MFSILTFLQCRFLISAMLEPGGLVTDADLDGITAVSVREIELVSSLEMVDWVLGRTLSLLVQVLAALLLLLLYIV